MASTLRLYAVYLNTTVLLKCLTPNTDTMILSGNKIKPAYAQEMFGNFKQSRLELEAGQV